MAYPTLTNLKTFLGISGSGEDGRLQFALDAAQSFVERSTHRVFVAASADKYFDQGFIREGGRLLALHRDFTSVSAVVNGDGVAVTQYYVLGQDAPYYAIRLDDDVVTPFYVGSDGTRVKVTAVWGFSTACPDDVFEAIMLAAQQFYNASQEGVGGVVGFRASSGVGIAPGTLHWFVQDVIVKYRRY